VDREDLTEDKVQTILDLAEGVKTVQVHALAFPFRELGTQMKGPIVEALFQDLRGQTIGGLLQGLRVRDSQKRIVFLSKGDAPSGQFGFHKVMAVDIIGGLEGEKRTDSQDHGTQDGVMDIEIVMRKATTGLTKDSVIGIGSCKLRREATEGGALFHTFEDEVEAIAVSPLHLTEGWSNDLLFASVLFCPLDGDAMVASIGFHPILVDPSSLHQDLFGDTRDANDLPENVDDVFWTGEHGQITMDHDPVKTMVNEGQH